MASKFSIEDLGKNLNNAAKNVGKAAKQVGKAAKDTAGAVNDYLKSDDFKEKTEAAKAAAGQAVSKVKEVGVNAKQAVYNAVDVDGDGEVTIEDVIIMGFKVPGVKINRDAYLRSEFFKHFPNEVIEDAILHNPAHAGITPEQIEPIAKEAINSERLKVSGISTGLGMPGGLAMAATIPADIAQYFGFMLRAAQKLLYLYGFPALDFQGDDQTLDSATMNQLVLCLGTMYGVAGARNGILALSKALAAGVEKKLINMALTKTAFYPIVKNIAKWFGVRLTKQLFAGFFKNAIPVIGGVIGGGITYFSFEPACNRLKDTLKDTILSNPQHKETKEEKDLTEQITIDADFTEIEPVARIAAEPETKQQPKQTMSFDQQIEAVKKLKELLDAGILTQEEFDEKKREVMGL